MQGLTNTDCFGAFSQRSAEKSLLHFCPFLTFSVLVVSVCYVLEVFIPVGNLLKNSILSFESSVYLCNLEALKSPSNNITVTFLVLVYNTNWCKGGNWILFFY